MVTRVAVVLTTILVAFPAWAATVSSASDTPTTLETSGAGDHTVVFTTPSDINEGETVTIGFASAFGTSAITEDDVDVLDDGVDLTTAADCSGAEEASVAMAADTLTITICAGDGGTIANGSVVTVKVGANASASGTGSNQVVNPSAAGTYYLSIAGTFGDSGSIALPIVANDTVSVTATISQGGGGGGDGGGGGGCGDTTNPILSGVSVTDITATSATVTWNTDESADSKVDYGTSASYGSLQTSTSLVSSHSVSLTGLNEGTTYHYRVRSADLCGNEASSSDATFSTLDNTAPVISDIAVNLSCDVSATVTWSTNEAATTETDYGLTSSYGSTDSDATLVTDHVSILNGLSQDTTYHYAVSSADASGNEASSTDRTFTTNQDAAPTNVSGLSVTAGDGQNSLSWTNPSDSDFDGVRVLVCTNGYPTSPTDPDCSTLVDGVLTSYTHAGLVNGTTYYYGVFAYDACGQFASGALGSGTPIAPEEEVPPQEEPPAEEPEAGPPPETPPSGNETSCGDGVCSATESAASCPSDCVPEEPAENLPEVPPVVTPPPTTVGEGELIPETDVQIFVAGGTIQLQPISTGEYRLLTARDLRVELLADHLTKSVDHVQLIVGAETYLMSLTNGDYLADVMSPKDVTSYNVALAVSVFYTDGTSQSLSYLVQVTEDGYTFIDTDEGRQRIGNSTVTLLTGESVWDGSPYHQSNPIITGADGSFAWYVPNGTYVVRAEKSGYEGALSGTLSVTDHIVHPAIGLSLLPEPTILPPVISTPIEQTLEVLEDVRSLPAVQTAVDVAVPVATVAAITTAASLAVAFDLFPFLQYLLTSPFLFFWRRKRKGYGVVYNGISKVPVDLAIVRLFQLPESTSVPGPLPQGRLMQSRVTDKGGRYFFLAQPGLYRITVTKNGFTFPSEYLHGVKDDGSYLDVYHGEAIRVSEQNAVIAANVPMDPSQGAEAHTPSKILWRKRLRSLQQVVAVSGVAISLVVVALRPSFLTAAMALVQLVVYFLARRLAAPKKPKSWGIVYDKETGRPVSSVVVRVFEPRYNKLLETTVTDSKGRYTALLGPNEYYSVFERAGYEPREIRPIDLRKNTEPTELAMNIDLVPEASEALPHESTTSGNEPPSSAQDAV